MFAELWNGRNVPVRAEPDTADLESGLFTSAAAGLDVFYAVRMRRDIPQDDLKQRERRAQRFQDTEDWVRETAL